MTNCDETQFKNQHGGLQLLTSVDGEDQYTTFRNNYQELTKSLVLPEADRSDKVADLFKIQGYYIGKEQLRCLLDSEFADFDGLQITLGLDTALADGTGRIALLLKGAFGSNTEDRGSQKVGNDVVDLRYFEESETAYAAAPPLIRTTPPPNSIPVPPYGKA